MTLRFLAAATALSLGLSVAAEARPTLSPPAAPAAAAASQAAAKPAGTQADAPVKPAGDRVAKYAGGAGAARKTGRDAYGFTGSYGGCRYDGHAGPHGYRVDRVC